MRRGCARLSVAFACVLGVMILALSLPRLAAALADLPARSIIATLRGGAEVPARFHAIAVEARLSSLEWVDDGAGWADLGYLYLRAALDTQDPVAAPEFERAERAHRRALNLSPAQAYAWTRMTHMELLRSGPNETAARFLELAMITAPGDRRLAFNRADLAFALWRHLNGGQRDLVAAQIRLGVEAGPGKLARLARDRRALAIVRSVLSPASDLRERFETALRRL